METTKFDIKRKQHSSSIFSREVLFHYLAFAASIVGILSLALLLATALFNAFGLKTADLFWYLCYILIVLLPLLAFSWYCKKNPAVGKVAIRAVGILVGGTLFGTLLLVIFILLDPQIAFLYFTFTVLPTSLVWFYARSQQKQSVYLSFAPLAAMIMGIFLSNFLSKLIPYFPADWLIFVWIFGPPVALLSRHFLKTTPLKSHRTHLAISVVLFSIIVGLFTNTFTEISPTTSVLYFLTILIPIFLYASTLLFSPEQNKLGLLFPLLLIATIFLARIVATSIGAAHPTPWLDLQFITSPPSRFPAEAGLYPALIGSIFIVILVGILSLIFGVGAAIYLEEYAPKTGPLGSLTRLVRINISNLAGVPSVVYGLLGLALFVNLLGMGFGTVIVSSMTLSLLILPIVIIASQEAIRTVPEAVRLASYGLGATKWQTIRNVVLPMSVGGILTGTILSMSRALGETAPLLMIGAATTVFKAPTGLDSKVSAMPLQVFHWAFSAKPDLRGGVAAAGIILLLFVLLSMNGIAIILRNKYRKDK
ncbi:MAG TPA: phosphate ABC transporter permease PstA [Halobacteriales archaeon]|jgi:phosphate transport system permease protein|nr:phosphate ABC transporter permease PstA [Halobacteriales archaeon]